MNSDYFLTKFPSPLEQAIFPRGKAGHQKKHVVHVNNSSVQRNRASTSWLEEYGTRCMPCPPYLLDFASSGFYLFPTVKEKLERIQVIDRDQLCDCLQEILAGINHDELNQVFRAWVQQVQELSQGIGDDLR
jgi:hypothetical protein